MPVNFARIALSVSSMVKTASTVVFMSRIPAFFAEEYTDAFVYRALRKNYCGLCHWQEVMALALITTVVLAVSTMAFVNYKMLKPPTARDFQNYRALQRGNDFVAPPPKPFLVPKLLQKLAFAMPIPWLLWALDQNLVPNFAEVVIKTKSLLCLRASRIVAFACGRWTTLGNKLAPPFRIGASSVAC